MLDTNLPRFALPALCLAVALAGVEETLAAAAAPRKGQSTVLGIDGTQFTLEGKPAFLLGISYYGALGAPEDFIRRDLDDLQDHGFNWLRVWATWAAFDHDVSCVDANGQRREPFLGKLQWLVAECDRRGLVVDVTLTRNAERLADLESHQRAVEFIVQALKPHSNWYLDLANEGDVRDDRYVSAAELKRLRELVRRFDPERLVTHIPHPPTRVDLGNLTRGWYLGQVATDRWPSVEVQGWARAYSMILRLSARFRLSRST